MPAKFENHESYGLISINGEINILNNNEFKTCFTEAFNAGQYKLIVDFKAASYIDSSAISVIITGRNTIVPKGGTLVFSCVPQSIEKVFTIIGFKNVVKMFKNLEEAVENITGNKNV